MAAPAAILNIVVAANTAPANAALMKTQGQLQRTAATGTATGATLKKAFLGVGVAAGAAAVGLFKVGEAFDDSFDTISVKTGATGKDLRKLKQSFRDVVADVPADFETVSKAIAGLNQRLEITGKPLERLTKQMVELSRITDTDVEENIQSVTRAFGDWEVKTKDQTEQLDKFYRASQDSGASVAELAAQVVQFGAPLRQVGFTLDEATAMFAQFEEAGVITQTMMPGLKFALRSFMEAGKDPQKALATTFQEITDGTMKAKEAFEVFGGRATPDMIEAIQQGRFELDELTKSIAKGDATIRDSARRTGDFTEQWQKFKNNALLALEPVARKVFRTVADEMKRVTDIMSDKDLTKGEKVNALADLVQEWMVRGVEKMAETAPKLAEAFVRGFMKADIWGQLLIGGWLLSKLGGPAAFTNFGTKTGTTAGKAFGRAFAAGAAAIIIYDMAKLIKEDLIPRIEEDFHGLIRGLLPGHGGGDSGGPDPAVQAKASMDTFEQAKKYQKQLGITEMKANSLVQFMKDHPGLGAPEAYKIMTGSLKNANDGWATHEKKVKINTEKVTAHSVRMARDVVRNNDNMVRGVGEGQKRLSENTNNALKAYGAKVLNYKIDLQKSGSSGSGFQRGGHINTGAASGDSVPALLERGEYVLNRNAVSKVGKGTLDRMNSAVPRFASGGLVQALGPYDIPPIQYDPNHAGSNSHLHLAMASVALAKSLASRISPLGWSASEAPWAGGVTVAHQDPGHYSGSSFDANAADESRSAVAAVARILGGGGIGAVATKLKRLMLDGPGGPLRSMGQGALDKSWKAAQAFINKSMPTVTSGNSSGVMNKAQIAKVWSQANRGQGNAGLMAAIALAESSGNPSAVGNDPGGTRGLGLWQITTGFNDDLIRKYGGESGMFNPLNNAKAAGDLLARQGLGAWVVYNTGAYQQFLQRGGMPSLDRGGRVTQSGLAQVHPGDVHMGRGGRPTINVYVDPVSLDVRVESIVEGMAPEIAEFTARQLGRGQGRSRQLSRG